MAYTSFSTTGLLSFSQWLDHRLCNDGQAYINTSSRLYYQSDPSLPASHVAYASPFRSWVCDSGVVGARIADRVSGSIGLGGTGSVMLGQSGMQIDYLNGRVILPVAVGVGAVITGSFAVKELNVYFTNQMAEKLVFSDKYYLNSRFARPITGIPPAAAMVTPCIFVTNEESESYGWAFGGLYSTKHQLRLTVMAETPGQLGSVMSLIGESQNGAFPQLPTSAWPLGPSGDAKGGYNYQSLVSQFGQPGNLFDITEVTATRVGDGVKIDQSAFIGLVDVTIERQRAIH